MLIFGYIKLLKNVASLGYKNNDMLVYLHLLLSANYTGGEYKGLKLNAGQLVTSYQSISDKLQLTEKAVKVAVKHLVDSGKIKFKGLPHKFSVCTITDYKLQTDNNTYNYTKLYRNIQAFDWYSDDITAKLYYYIMLNYTADGCKYKPIDVQLALNIDKKQYTKHIKRLSDSGAVIVTPQGRYTIIKIVGDIDKEEKPKEKKEVVSKIKKEEKTEEKIIGLCSSENEDLSNVVLF